MGEDYEEYNYSEDELDDVKHEKLVDNVLNLSKVQHVKKASRTEPTSQISEFNLVKSVTGNKGFVHLNELANTLKNRKKHAKTKDKILTSNKKSKTLPKPLEKPQADRIARTVNYEKSRLDFDRWEAFVAANRSAVHQVFPLDSIEKIKNEQKQAETYSNSWKVKSELQKALEKLEPKVETYHIDEDEQKYPLTLKELKEKRQEAAKLRAHQSFKEAKARRQNKIKSKKYHRILKRERVKQKLKEFEELQKTDPEEALKKLEEIEKARAEERFNLRHKGTGQWAKNKQIRAKYDKESRQVLAQQLSIGRELTQKTKVVESDSDEENPEDNNFIDKSSLDNPWTNIKPDKEVSDFVSGYRKYWNEKNKNRQEDENSNTEKKTDDDDDIEETVDDECKIEIQTNGQIEEKGEGEKDQAQMKKNEKSKKKLNAKKVKRKVEQQLSSSGSWDAIIEDTVESQPKVKKSKKLLDVDEMFDDAENNIENNVSKKLKTLNETSTTTKKIKKRTRKSSKKNKKIDLSLKSKNKKAIIDEELNETTHDNNEDDSNTRITTLKNILQSVTENVEKSSNDIDPNKFVQKSNPTDLDTAIPDLLTNNDETDEMDDDQRKLIVEAFEDDDIVQDFNKEKAKEIEKDTPKDIDLNLPGWGSWGGTNIKTKRKRKRFILKMPKNLPRRDDNKGSLIINEKAQRKIKDHMVSAVPFPFKTIKDYEASIRAPIGSTFVSETAFRRLVRPAVKTQIGAIIEPVTKDMLVGKKKK